MRACGLDALLRCLEDFFQFWIFFLNLIYNFGPQFRNFTEMDPCRPATGTCRPTTGRQDPCRLSPSGRAIGCFFAKFTRPETSKCSAEVLRGACRSATGRRGLSPGGRATGPLPPIKCVCPPPGRSFGARNFQKKERGAGKVKRRSPAGILACDL